MELVTIIVIVLSLVLVYFLGSTLVSLLIELWSSLWNNREKFLEKQLTDKLGEETAKQILGHTMVSSSSQNGTSNISPKVFGYVANQHLDKDSKQVLKSAIEAYGTTGSSTPTSKSTEDAKATEAESTETEIANTSESTTSDSQSATPADSISTADNRNALSSWYEDYSKDLSAQYKRSLRIPSILVATLVVVLLNLDTLRIIKTIWENPQDNQEILSTLSQIDWASLATEQPDPTDTESTNERVKEILLVISKLDTLESAGLPLGWQTGEDLGMVIPANDTSTVLNFNRIMAVDTVNGRSDTSYSFSYRPPSGAASFQPDAIVAEKMKKLMAVFPSAIPQPNPRLKQDGGELKLDFSNVFGLRKVDSVMAKFQGISGDVYAFKTSAHQEIIRPSFFQVLVANIQLVDGVTLLGWLISIIAISMGAPFWYDILKRLSQYVTSTAK